jgi:hypothetical protein
MIVFAPRKLSNDESIPTPLKMSALMTGNNIARSSMVLRLNFLNLFSGSSDLPFFLHRVVEATEFAN